MIPPIWERQTADPADVDRLSRALGLEPVIARLLAMRGLTDPDAAARFLKPSLDQLHDPSLLAGLPEAMARIRQALASGERIAIHGDYDVDGITSTVILRRTLELLGGNVGHFIPERLKDGYGLQPATVDLVALRVLAQRGHEGLGHALALHPQRVDHVGAGEAVVEVVGDLAAEGLDPARQQRGRPAHGDLGAELAEGEDVRAGHARVRDVADDPDRAPLERPELVPQRVDVEQRLGRVLVLAVARVDDRGRGPARYQFGGAHVRGADDDGGRVVGRERLDGVLERLALVDRRAGAAHRDDVGA